MKFKINLPENTYELFSDTIDEIIVELESELDICGKFISKNYVITYEPSRSKIESISITFPDEVYNKYTEQINNIINDYRNHLQLVDSDINILRYRKVK